MSVYSGFSTRKLETDYGVLTSSLISLLHYKVLNSFKRTQIDEDRWAKALLQTHASLAKIELHKHLPPKFSRLCDDLVLVLGGAVLSQKSLDLPRAASLAPSVKLPEIRPIREKSIELQISNTSLRGKKQKRSNLPSPKLGKSGYYEKVFEQMFDVDMWVEKESGGGNETERGGGMGKKGRVSKYLRERG
jgi:hypothetical protein